MIVSTQKSSKSDFYDDFENNSTDGGRKYKFEFFTNTKTNWRLIKTSKLQEFREGYQLKKKNTI